jgi:hypothetical protein
MTDQPPSNMWERFKKNYAMLRELFLMITVTKKFWLLPLLLVLVLLALFAGLTGNQSILPAIYALF